MIKYIITHGCSNTDGFCGRKTKVEGEALQEIINHIDKIEDEYPIYRIESIVNELVPLE